MRDVAESVRRAWEQVAGGASLDDVLDAMKVGGRTPVDCIRVVIELTGCALTQATQTVARSPAWAHLNQPDRWTRERELRMAVLERVLGGLVVWIEGDRGR